MSLNVWTKPSGYNLGHEPRSDALVPSGQFIAGYEYIITTVGTTDFTKIGAAYNTVGIIFTATNTGQAAGPLIPTLNNSTLETAGSGVASRVAYSERIPLELILPVTSEPGVTFSLISGSLPAGLRLEGNKIIGATAEVARLTNFTFCIRASKAGQISDRTLNLTIEGEDKPEFITPEGLLNIGDPGELFVIDGTFVDYQIAVEDLDTRAGQKLSYFIARNDGSLPPGLVLTNDGRIVGFVQPALAITPKDGDGTYDDSYYDAVAFDFAFIPTNGYDSYVYDTVFFDFALATSRPKKLNRTYQFTITVTDGDSFTKRTFKMFIVGDDYFRADNTTWLSGNSLFNADVTYLRPPSWLTPSYLGLYRANNYVTLILDTYDRDNVIYSLEQVNADSRAKTFQISETDNAQGGFLLTTEMTTPAPVVGHFLTFSGLIQGSTVINRVDNVQSLGDGRYRLTLYYPLESDIPNGLDLLIGTLSQIPTGMQFDENTAEVHGLVPYQPAITKSYKFTVNATRISEKGERASTPKIFTVDLLGEVDSVLEWNTPSDLGTINANFVSTLSVQASSTISSSTLLYNLTEGRLPPGLTLDLDGQIVGKVNQYAVIEDDNLILPGLTTFDNVVDPTTFDGNTTSVDRIYTFTVTARDQFGYSAISRTFTISTATPDQLVYSNIKVKPFLKNNQRTIWRQFIDNTSIFTPLNIYRPNDPNFGLQRDLSMLIYAGIETKEAAAYISAIGLNHKRKRFQFGNVKTATAFLPGTKTAIYEIVYVQMLDPLEPNGKRLANKLSNLSLQPSTISVDSSNSIWSRNLADLIVDAPNNERPDPIITVDSTGYEVSNPNLGDYFPSSISNWRERLKTWKDDNGSGFANERNYLPLWMRSIQPGTKQEIDFQLAVPLCYCKVGTSADIVLNIKNYLNTTDFSFNQLDYTADRYIIDSVEGLTADKYLVFRNDRITI